MAGIVFSKLSGKNDSLYKAVEGVLTEVIADAEKEVNRHDEVLTAMCAMKTSDKFGERVGGRTTFGDFAPIPEGGVIVKDEIEEGFGKLVQHTAFAKGFTTTHEMAADGDVDAASAVAREFVESYKRSRLDFATAYLTTEGTTFQYGGKTFDKTTGDGVGFFSTGHLNKKNSATQSNVFTNAFGTTSDMLNRLAVIGRNFKDDSYNPTGWTFDTIIIPSNCYALEDTIKKVIASEQVVGSNYNDINTQKGKWKLVINHRWEAAAGTAPYILMASEANKNYGALRWYEREALDIRNWVDENTRNLEWSGYCRQSILGADWKGFILGGAQSGTSLL